MKESVEFVGIHVVIVFVSFELRRKAESIGGGNDCFKRKSLRQTFTRMIVEPKWMNFVDEIVKQIHRFRVDVMERR